MLNVIFMVDDDQDDREIFHEAISKVCPSAEIIFARDGGEALGILSNVKANPQVIFLDYNMPGMTGVQCLRALKANVKTREIPVIMYTTSGDREEEKLSLLLGADHYLQKTTNFVHLCTELQRLLQLVQNKSRHSA